MWGGREGAAETTSAGPVHPNRGSLGTGLDDSRLGQRFVVPYYTYTRYGITLSILKQS